MNISLIIICKGELRAAASHQMYTRAIRFIGRQYFSLHIPFYEERYNTVNFSSATYCSVGKEAGRKVGKEGTNRGTAGGRERGR